MVISIDYDMFLRFVLLMGGHGGSFTVVDCCIAMMCHNVMDDSSIWSGVAVILMLTTFSPGCIVVDNNSVRSGQLQLSSVFGRG